MKTKIICTTEQERNAYHKTKPVYPLYGYVIKNGNKWVIEDLRGSHDGDPKFEVMAPDGYVFEPDGVHTLLCVDHADIIERVDSLFIMKDAELES